MSKRKSAKLRTFRGRTIHDMKYFIAVCLRKRTNEIVLHVSIDDAHSKFQDMLILAIFFKKSIYYQ